MDINELHRKYFFNNEYDRIFPNINNSIVNKSGNTVNLSQAEVKKCMEHKDEGYFSCIAGVIIEYRTEKEGIKLANRFKKLAQIPNVRLNIIFKKIK